MCSTVAVKMGCVVLQIYCGYPVVHPPVRDSGGEVQAADSEVGIAHEIVGEDLSVPLLTLWPHNS